MKRVLVLLIVFSFMLLACNIEVIKKGDKFRPTIHFLLELLPDFQLLNSTPSYSNYCARPNTKTTTSLEKNDINTICLWVFKNEPHNLITQIFVYYLQDNPALSEMIDQYGFPEKIMWSGWPFYRFVIWPGQGVIALIHYNKNIYTTNAIYVIYFSPMSFDEFAIEYPNWPWDFALTHISEENMYQKGQHGVWDNLSQDPFDWKALTPTPDK